MDELFASLTWALHWLCHQRPERSPHLWGAQFPLCWRCGGILVGLFCCALLLFFTRRLPAPRLSFMLALLLPLDVLLGVAHVWSGANSVRFITGVLWGMCATSLALHFAVRVAAWKGQSRYGFQSSRNSQVVTSQPITRQERA